MSEVNKTYRIRTQVGSEASDGYISLDANLVQDYEAFDILSVKISSSDTYRLHNANYGVVVGRVIANNGFGVPNAKLSIFIESDSSDGEKVKELYPFIASYSKDLNGVRYNLLPDEEVGDCHQIVGTFPNKRYLLDNDVVLEVFDKYYTFTTRTNNSGDYLIMGVPVGTHTLHMDLDLSDCGILSQRPRDFVYKGYTVEQFENPNKFKSGTDYENLSQVFTQDRVVNVQPFWGNESLGETIGLTRADINISFEFQPTCVFIGSVVSDKSSDGITKKCMATENMGNMEEMTTGEGTIEMIRKTPNGSIEEFQIKGTQLIDSNGVWCYQIPMNLDYMMTDEYGNMVPTDDPSKGIPTRCSARFRISMQDNEENVDNFFRAKVLVPHNPQNLPGGEHEEYDYEFGSKTRDDSFRDLFWNNVYTVKSYIPRFQKRKTRGWRDKKFTGIKSCNFSGTNNPIPYNNIRIKLPLMFTILCAIIKCFIYLTGVFNTIINRIGLFLAKLGGIKIIKWRPFGVAWDAALDLKLNVLSEGLCPDLENWFFAPVMGRKLKTHKQYNLLRQTITYLTSDNGFEDEKSIEYENGEAEDNVLCLTINTDYLISCVEMNLAMEYKVINFDFYNDWINGLIYIPRFMRYLRPKKTFLGITFAKAKIKGCMDDTKIFSKTRRYTQQCSLSYNANKASGGAIIYSNVDNPLAKNKSKSAIRKANNLHKSRGFSQKTIFGRNGGICHEHVTSMKQNVYYMKPCEWTNNTNPKNMKVTLFATDIVLLGSLNDCDLNGIPQAFKYLSSTSYVMPTNLALTNMETNATLYANEKGTICAGAGGQLPVNDNSDSNGVQVIPVSSGLSGEIKYYKNAKDENIDTTYETNELSDIVALTESAGISWDYTGPGQGTPDPKSIYYPGGHFLGLTCTNSQTNLKSCINLERICEVGANMSQRKEDVRKIDDKGNLEYVYYAPSGFISGNDIIAEDFRVMFSTMNQNRLIANKIDPNTGYKIYDFSYVHPINFDGSFKNVIKNNVKYNNKGNELVPKEDDSTFRSVGIESNVREHPDGDSKEKIYTFTRTIEDSSVDYYRFRFGLENNNLKKDDEIQRRQFLIHKNNKYLLPQYENSFYFYFGMKPGSSAIDEFNKQFFSQCSNKALSVGSPDFKVDINEINVCDGNGSVKLTIENMDTPYSRVYYTIEGEEMKQISGDETPENLEDDEYEMVTHEVPDVDNLRTFVIDDLNFGNYSFTIIDANGLTLTKDIQFGTNIMSVDITRHNFNVLDYKTLSGNTNLNIFDGGYFTFENLSIKEEYSDILNGATFKIIIKNDGNVVASSTTTSLESTIELPVSSANVIYDIYLSYKCNGPKNFINEIYYTSYTFNDGGSVSLNMGWKNAPLYLEVGTDSKNGNLSYGINEWWKGIDVVKENKDKDWLKKVCLFKESQSSDTFSNNVFVINGTKVIWGTPQNEETVYNGKPNVFSSEDNSDLYDGYTLDDDYSYFPTIPSSSGNVHYSAIAVNETTVAGDYWATLNNSQSGWVSSQKFTNGMGYVFKPLPNGELQYHIYNGSLKYDKYILEDGTVLMESEKEELYGTDKNFENNGGTIIKNGIFYPSFVYPVMGVPFKADLNFYVWEGKGVIFDESIGVPQSTNEQECGRTEAVITNGITYNGKFYKSYIQNIRHTELENKLADIIETNSDIYISTNNRDRSLTISGMTVDISSLESTMYDEDVKPVYKDAFVTSSINGEQYTYAKGFSGLTELPYELEEGHPDSLNFNGEKIDTLSTYVNSISDSIGIDDLFSESIYYNILNKIGNEYQIEFMCRSNTKICVQSGNSRNDLLYRPPLKSNESYIYEKRGKKEPIYNILAMYNETAEFNKLNELCFINVDYSRPRKMTYSIPYLNEDGDTVYKSGSNRGGDAKSNRNNISWFMDAMGMNGVDTKVTPVQNVLINANTKENWYKHLEEDAKTSDKAYYELELSDNDILYAYEDIEIPGLNNSTVKVYKIFPVLLPVVKDKNLPDIYVLSADTSGNEMEISYIEIQDSGTTESATTEFTDFAEIKVRYYSTISEDTENNVPLDESEKYDTLYLKVLDSDSEPKEIKPNSASEFTFNWMKLSVSPAQIKYEGAEEDGVKEYISAITHTIKIEAKPDGLSYSDILRFYLTEGDDTEGQNFSIIKHGTKNEEQGTILKFRYSSNVQIPHYAIKLTVENGNTEQFLEYNFPEENIAEMGEKTFNVENKLGVNTISLSNNIQGRMKFKTPNGEVITISNLDDEFEWYYHFNFEENNTYEITITEFVQ